MNDNIAAGAVLDLARDLVEAKILDKPTLDAFNEEFSNWVINNTPPDSIEGNDLRLPESYFLWLWNVLAQSKNAIQLAITIGKKVDFSSTGILANWISHCPTLAIALKTFCDNIVLLNPNEHWALLQFKQYTQIEIKFTQPHYPNIAELRSISAALAWANQLSGGNITPTTINLSLPQPSRDNQNWVASQEGLGKELASIINYDADVSALVFRTQDLDRPIVGNSPYIHNILTNKAQALTEKLANLSPISLQLQQLLKSNLQHYCHLSNAIQSMNISKANLARKLKNEGTSFSELLDEERKQRFYSMDRKTNASEMCHHLAFNSESAFYRARKRWQK